MARYDTFDMGRKSTRRQIITDNAYKGIACEIIDSWDNDEIQPIAGIVDPLTIIPDPKCWDTSYMRFIGFERRLPSWQIKDNDAFNLR